MEQITQKLQSSKLQDETDPKRVTFGFFGDQSTGKSITIGKILKHTGSLKSDDLALMNEMCEEGENPYSLYLYRNYKSFREKRKPFAPFKSVIAFNPKSSHTQRIRQQFTTALFKTLWSVS